jgi:thiol:disulfide interchange protein DsbC
MAQEAAIRKHLAERMPNLPHIDEISKTPLPGIYELRIGNDILYTDADGGYVFDGVITDAKSHVNLTDARIAQLSKIDFDALSLEDAVVWTQGNGGRKMVVFADPNCGYCKRLERDLLQVKDLTVYTFLIPILGGDSPQKARDIWCANEPGKVWRDWMIQGKAAERASPECDVSALDRNLAFAKRHKVDGTPALVFPDSTRVSGLLPVEGVERRLVAVRAPN